LPVRPSRLGSTQALVEDLLRYIVRTAHGLGDPEATAALRSRSRHRPQRHSSAVGPVRTRVLLSSRLLTPHMVAGPPRARGRRCPGLRRRAPSRVDRWLLHRRRVPWRTVDTPTVPTNELNGFETGTTLRPHRSSSDPIDRDRAETETNQRKGPFIDLPPGAPREDRSTWTVSAWRTRADQQERGAERKRALVTAAARAPCRRS